MRKYVALALTLLFVVLSLPCYADWVWTPQTKRWINLDRLPKETAELQVEYARRLMLDGDLKKAIRETGKFEDYFGDTDQADNNQYLRGEIRMVQGNHLDAAKEFQQVISSYPSTELFDDVLAKQREIGDQMYELGKKRIKSRWRFIGERKQLKRAIEVYAMVVDNQPFSDSAAESQYKIGRCHFELGEYTESAYEFRRTIEDYSNSGWVDEAVYGLAESYYTFSLPPAYDQVPSYLAISAIDDFKARYPDDSRVEHLDKTRAEMRESIAEQRFETAKFYEKRRRFDSARTYCEVIIEEFSDTSVADKAQKWLDKNPTKSGGI